MKHIMIAVHMNSNRIYICSTSIIGTLRRKLFGQNLAQLSSAQPGDAQHLAKLRGLGHAQEGGDHCLKRGGGDFQSHNARSCAMVNRIDY